MTPSSSLVVRSHWFTAWRIASPAGEAQAAPRYGVKVAPMTWMPCECARRARGLPSYRERIDSSGANCLAEAGDILIQGAQLRRIELLTNLHQDARIFLFELGPRHLHAINSGKHLGLVLKLLGGQGA